MVRNYQRRQLLIRVVSFILSLLLLACCSVLPITQAKALAPVIAYGAKELVAALLIAGGASFATSNEAREAAAKVWDWLGQNAADTAGKIEQLIQQQIEISETLGNGAIRISSSIWDVLQTAWNFYFPSSGVNYGVEYRVEEGEWNSDIYGGGFGFSDAWENAITSIYIAEYDITYSVSPSYVQAGEEYFVYRNDEVERHTTAIKSGYVYFYANYSLKNSKGSLGASVFQGDSSNSEAFDLGTFALPASLYFYSDVVSPGLVYPGEDTMIYVPDIPEVQTDEEGKDVVIWPDLSLNPDDFVLDIPKTATGDLVDVPYDTLVDASTGTAVGEGEGAGEGEGTPSGTLPESGDLSLPKLIISKFPFCIPFDVANMVGQLNAEPEPLVIRIPVKITDRISTQYITIDFSQYESIIQVVRWGIYALFLAGLAYATRNYIKW